MPFTPNPNLDPKKKSAQLTPDPIEQEPDLALESDAPETEFAQEPEVTTASEPVDSKPEAAAEDPESTIGTGTSMALGCVAGTVVLIGFGLLFLFLSTLF